jgi:hypothetical protein
MRVAGQALEKVAGGNRPSHRRPKPALTAGPPPIQISSSQQLVYGRLRVLPVALFLEELSPAGREQRCGRNTPL